MVYVHPVAVGPGRASVMFTRARKRGSGGPARARVGVGYPSLAEALNHTNSHTTPQTPMSCPSRIVRAAATRFLGTR
jgi:hypothetical protein